MDSPSINDTLGAVFIGNYISLVLYGLVLHQAYRYYVNYPFDKRWLKTYVAIVLVLEFVCTVLTCHMCYYYGVYNYANPPSLAYIVWSIPTLSIIGALMVVLTQCFFLRRVWLIGRHYRPIVAIASVFMMLEMSVCVVYGVDAFRSRTWKAMISRVWFVSAHTSASAVADLLITWALISTLRQNQERGMQRTNDMINDLILYSVSTGLVTGVYNVVCFILSLLLPRTLLYWATVMVGLKLYSNSLLAALNSRRSISARHPAGVTDTSPFGVSIQPSNTFELERSRKHTSQAVTSWNVRSLADSESIDDIEGSGIAVKVTKEVIHEPSASEMKLTNDALNNV